MEPHEQTKGHILIAEDDPLIREVCRKVLELEGYRISLAAEGRQALARIQEEKPDVILLDLLMPGCSGLEVFRQLPAEGPAAPMVIVITAYASTENAIAALRLARTTSFGDRSRGGVNGV